MCCNRSCNVSHTHRAPAVLNDLKGRWPNICPPFFSTLILFFSSVHPSNLFIKALGEWAAGEAKEELVHPWQMCTHTYAYLGMRILLCAHEPFYIPFLSSLSLCALALSLTVSQLYQSFYLLYPLFSFSAISASSKHFKCIKVNISPSFFLHSWSQQGETGVKNNQSGHRLCQC